MIGPMSAGFLLAPSILSADFAHLGAAIREAEEGGADWIHVDVMDGHYVPNLSFGPVIVEACRRVTDLPLDVHLMVDRPSTLLQDFAKAGADILTVHPEADPHLHRTLDAIRDLGLRAGVALNPGTPAIAVREILHMVDLVMVMSVNPGYSGQAFIPSVLDKMRTIRDWIEQRELKTKIEADGGITAETAPLTAEAGAEIFVAATSVFRHPEGIKAGLEALRQSLQRK
jgi:ribulose-phosphate 3-epimerase